MPELIYRDETRQLIGFCMEIHRELGKGHDEVIYKDALVVELSRGKVPFTREKPYEVRYKNVILPHHYKADFVISDEILFESQGCGKTQRRACQAGFELPGSLEAPVGSAGQLRRRFARVEARDFVNPC